MTKKEDVLYQFNVNVYDEREEYKKNGADGYGGERVQLNIRQDSMWKNITW